MNYFLTGGTGFIGRFFIENLLQRQGTIHVLVRESSQHKLEELKARFPLAAERIVAVTGDITRPGLGLCAADLERLQGSIDHFFHFAAIYDMAASEASQNAANISGTLHAVNAAAQLGAGCFHHVSSIAVSGLYRGTFREDMFEEAENVEHPYFQTKHDSERIVRQEARIPWRVYRPGLVVGDSKTGEMDKIDGPYYFFKLIQRMRQFLPPWMPTIGIEGGRINIVPVDFVVDAINHIAHHKGHDGKAFHLVDPTPMRVGDLLNTFARAAHAPPEVQDAVALWFYDHGGRSAWNGSGC